MAYEAVDAKAGAIRGYGGPGLLEARELGKAPSRCPPFKFHFDKHCPLPPLEFHRRRQDLCNRIVAAIGLAQKAASRLEARPLRQDTLDWFQRIPLAYWELPWAPRRTMAAGDIVARRFRTVDQELRTRDTMYRCVSSALCRGAGAGPGPGPEEPAHPTETIVRDLVAVAVLCKDEVWLCPSFWALKRAA